MEDDVPRHAHGVEQIPLNLVQDVFRRATKKDGASLGVLALGQEGKVFVTDLGDLEQATFGSDV